MGRKREIYEVGGKKYLKCHWCWELKEMTSEFWHKSPNTSVWFVSRCKKCIAEFEKMDYQNKIEIKREKSRNYNRTHKKEIRLYRERTKEHIREHWAEYRKNSDVFKEYQKQYDKEHRAEINERKKKRRQEVGYWAIHTKTARTIAKLWIRPKVCPICWDVVRVEAHHPNYNKRNEIIRACNKCHQRIHNWWLECPKDIIDLLSF